MSKARDADWRKKELSLKEVQEKFPDLPKEWILKVDLQRRGLTFTPAALEKLDLSRHSVVTNTWGRLGNGPEAAPEGLIMKDGSYLIANFDFDADRPQRDPYTIDVQDDTILVTDEGEILTEIQGYWEKPKFYDKKASNGRPLSDYVQSRPQRLDVPFYHYCHFWDTPGEGCKYCPWTPQYLAKGRGEEHGEYLYFREAFAEALKQSGRYTAIMITGGSVLGGKEVFDDELESYIRLLQVIGEFFETDRFPAQLICSAFNRRQLERLYQETGLMMYTTDIEILNKERFEQICVGKARHVGYEEWKQRLYDAVDVFGKGNVTSGVVLGAELAKPMGFESEDEAFKNITEQAEEIISHGITLAANVWRSAPYSVFQNQDTPSLDYFVRCYRKFDRLQHKYCPNPYTDDFRRCGAHIGMDLMRV